MKLKFLLLLLAIAIIFIIANPVLAKGNKPVPVPTLSSRTVFVNDIFDPHWWLFIPTNFVNDIFNPIWWVNVQAHFSNDIFNSWWWLGPHPSKTPTQPMVDRDAAQKVIAEINALPAKNALDLPDALAVSTANKDYNALTSAQRALVTNYPTLTIDKAQITSLQDALENNAVAEPAVNQNPVPTQKETNQIQAPVQSTNLTPSPVPAPAPASKPKCDSDALHYCKFFTGWLDPGAHHLFADWVCDCNACYLIPADADNEVCGPPPVLYLF